MEYRMYGIDARLLYFSLGIISVSPPSCPMLYTIPLALRCLCTGQIPLMVMPCSIFMISR
ncbi:unnamed protein product [Penicillium roqueforti FM164]|uniref:Genomic scaffold, ProqFM164S03 n=1 Tax=Penicillium roqueforti (strain FM164) TaxID=1365484 RepID=W6QGV7_PENRF|nr:unnamed protein product [Penicillium roqueforti FM164]